MLSRKTYHSSCQASLNYPVDRLLAILLGHFAQRRYPALMSPPTRSIDPNCKPDSSTPPWLSLWPDQSPAQSTFQPTSPPDKSNSPIQIVSSPFSPPSFWYLGWNLSLVKLVYPLSILWIFLLRWNFSWKRLAILFLSEISSVVFAETEVIVPTAEDRALPAELTGIGTEHL